MILGYFIIGLIYSMLRVIYHIICDRQTDVKLKIYIKNELVNFCDFFKQIIISKSLIAKVIAVILFFNTISSLLPFSTEIIDVYDDISSTIMYSLLIVLFVPKYDAECKNFPLVVLGFIYSVMLMYYYSGSAVYDIFYFTGYVVTDIWIYGYCVTIISYIVCIFTLSRFMDRVLPREEYLFLAILMLILLEFITYFGIGVFSEIEQYEAVTANLNIFEGITAIIDRGVFLSAQAQTAGKPTKEIIGYIFLNGSDLITMTIVFGYLIQKVVEKKNK